MRRQLLPPRPVKLAATMAMLPGKIPMVGMPMPMSSVVVERGENEVVVGTEEMNVISLVG